MPPLNQLGSSPLPISLFNGDVFGFESGELSQPVTPFTATLLEIFGGVPLIQSNESADSEGADGGSAAGELSDDIQSSDSDAGEDAGLEFNQSLILSVDVTGDSDVSDDNHSNSFVAGAGDGEDAAGRNGED